MYLGGGSSMGMLVVVLLLFRLFGDGSDIGMSAMCSPIGGRYSSCIL